MPNLKFFNIIIILTLALFVQNCGGKIGADARKYPPDPKKEFRKI